MTITSGVCKAFIGGLCLLAGMAVFSQPRPPQSSSDLSYRIVRTPLPVAAYRNISAAEFRLMVRKAFQASGFSFISVDEQKNKSTINRFSLIVDPKIKFKPTILVSTDESLDSRRRCNPCFLRFTEVANASEIGELPWMTQYDLNALLIQAIDKAYSNIESSGRTYQDPSFSFSYKPQWAGEQNLFGNSYIGISLPDLKERIINAYRKAGFISIEKETNPKASELDMTFNFPIDPAKDGGAVYELIVRSQFDENGHCYPCEVIERYNPYQRLPPAGLSGVLDRATLESRFSAARTAAYESIRIDLERYLRPRSKFTVPSKPAPLGSPPLPPTPVIVT
ncbi:hypothetical protein [Variovorax sp. GB1P17]|uniref:hypothetical protein n=1 Tax=Variovorax sp. GB1P17 TaxID=3443740 RepID=UPI003F451B41